MPSAPVTCPSALLPGLLAVFFRQNLCRGCPPCFSASPTAASLDMVFQPHLVSALRVVVATAPLPSLFDVFLVAPATLVPALIALMFPPTPCVRTLVTFSCVRPHTYPAIERHALRSTVQHRILSCNYPAACRNSSYLQHTPCSCPPLQPCPCCMHLFACVMLYSLSCHARYVSSSFVSFTQYYIAYTW
jgi:hypothetical protein